MLIENDHGEILDGIKFFLKINANEKIKCHLNQQYFEIEKWQ